MSTVEDSLIKFLDSIAAAYGVADAVIEIKLDPRVYELLRQEIWDRLKDVTSDQEVKHIVFVSSGGPVKLSKGWFE